MKNSPGINITAPIATIHQDAMNFWRDCFSNRFHSVCKEAERKSRAIARMGIQRSFRSDGHGPERFSHYFNEEHTKIDGLNCYPAGRPQVVAKCLNEIFNLFLFVISRNQLLRLASYRTPFADQRIYEH